MNQIQKHPDSLVSALEALDDVGCDFSLEVFELPGLLEAAEHPPAVVGSDPVISPLLDHRGCLVYP